MSPIWRARGYLRAFEEQIKLLAPCETRTRLVTVYLALDALLEQIERDCQADDDLGDTHL